ncbi:MAG: bis(5'-nucleosyl)-tetraphosphatase (symmetrical) YqeK [Clostridia bacterium]|jgi:nicotinate-nucleotide adenylyltransferase|nr:bis(5'-nucleosyl)-tetraphosphatase (symmetrical) YqeK [Clostridia bacterium]MBQ5956666.1 bis(5'-nucleosyl)-tetraphosphatase (symmetrical) YqeK [Clostridia bacterium]MBR3563694.1 bis(5'-nucleosyl)-tetraphosphatase (symmetrical) YqeK [Clostridia bacterium]MBR6822840.1 bis(5'-nucleosyl)-tetraphosphatase (symmetrical) YqeK [Clostridia bacterium]
MRRGFMYNREELLNIVGSALSEKRFRHTLGVEKMAINLAMVYDEDREKASVAALLHDYAKELPKPFLLKKAAESGIEMDPVYISSPGLLHGPVGAVLVRERFGIEDEDILNAITYHTVGRVGMSKLEKIIYLADITEENRVFDDVERIREKQMQGLDEGLLESLRQTIVFTVERGLMVHHNSIDLYNSILEKRG